MKYLLDTGIAQDLQADRNGVQEEAYSRLKAGHRVGICTPVLGELYKPSPPGSTAPIPPLPEAPQP